MLDMCGICWLAGSPSAGLPNKRHKASSAVATPSPRKQGPAKFPYDLLDHVRFDATLARRLQVYKLCAFPRTMTSQAHVVFEHMSHQLPVPAGAICTQGRDNCIPGWPACEHSHRQHWPAEYQAEGAANFLLQHHRKRLTIWSLTIVRQ